MQFRVIALLAAFAAYVSAIPTNAGPQLAPSQDQIDKHMKDVNANGCKVLRTYLISFSSSPNSNNS